MKFQCGVKIVRVYMIFQCAYIILSVSIISFWSGMPVRSQWLTGKKSLTFNCLLIDACVIRVFSLHFTVSLRPWVFTWKIETFFTSLRNLTSVSKTEVKSQPQWNSLRPFYVNTLVHLMTNRRGFSLRTEISLRLNFTSPIM